MKNSPFKCLSYFFILTSILFGLRWMKFNGYLTRFELATTKTNAKDRNNPRLMETGATFLPHLSGRRRPFGNLLFGHVCSHSGWIQKQRGYGVQTRPQTPCEPPEENVGPMGSAFPQLPWQCRTLSRRCHIDEADSLASCCMSAGEVVTGEPRSLVYGGKSGNVCFCWFFQIVCVVGERIRGNGGSKV